MVLQGTVTNVISFGAFVDIGVHQDGLIHISELSDQFVTDPATVVSVGDVLQVRVLEVDKPRKRISLSAKSPAKPNAANSTASTEPQSRHGANTSQRQGNAQLKKPPTSTSPQMPPRSSPKQPDMTYSVNDLLSKFSKK
jgi:uncharacterized protein